MAHVWGRYAWLVIGLSAGVFTPTCPPSAGAAPSITFDRTPPERPRGTMRLETVEAYVWSARGLQVAAASALVAMAWLLHRARIRGLRHQLHVRAEERLAERSRIAQDLYDTLLQGLLGASMQLHMAVDDLPDDSPHKHRFVAALRTIGHVADEGRNVLRGLREAGADGQDLEVIVSRVVGEIGTAEVAFGVVTHGVARGMPPIVCEEVTRVAREALLNAFRHAGAKAIAVEIHYRPRALRLVVRDDGVGTAFDRQRGGGNRRRGLAEMHARARTLGARLRVRGRPGGGTVVALTVPGAIAYTAGVPAGEVSRA